MFKFHAPSILLLAALAPAALHGQAPAASPARQLGTVKSISGNTILLTNAKGADVSVTLDPAAAVLQLPPGSTDLKTAHPAALTDISVGDRVVTGKTGDTDVATRVILMKSSDIASRNAAEQGDWQHNGTGGLVRSVQGNTITVVAGARTLTVTTSPDTRFRRYADDSIAFSDAKAGTLDQIHPGDQLRARGVLSADRSSVEAKEVVTGTFDNLSGELASVDPAAGTLTFKDLTTKKMVTVKVTANSDLRALPPQAAAAFAARSRSGRTETAQRPAGATAAAGATGAAGEGERARSAGMDLSQMLSRLPAATLSELHPGDAVLIVATPDRAAGGNRMTAITLLSGVEPLLTAASSGGESITLSPWNLGAPDAAGSPQ